jgi:FAD/FMN-containing dehydrogenase
MDGSVVVIYAPPEFKAKVDVWGDVGGMLPLMQQLKRAFDPRVILNPGRYVGGV